MTVVCVMHTMVGIATLFFKLLKYNIIIKAPMSESRTCYEHFVFTLLESIVPLLPFTSPHYDMLTITINDCRILDDVGGRVHAVKSIYVTDESGIDSAVRNRPQIACILLTNV